MSADEDLTDVQAWAFYYAPEPLKSKLERTLARLEAAEENCRDAEANYLREFARANAAEDALAALAGEPTMLERLRAAEAQRDALAEARDVALIALARRTTQRDAVAEALRKLANPTHEPKGEEAVLLQMEVAQIARAALAEAGLE